MRTILVGAGLVAGFWMEPLRARSEVAALVELDEERVAAALARFDLGCPGFTDLEDALASVPAEAIVNLTPPARHRAVNELALAAGCHVLCEKPLALTYEDALASVTAARRAGRHLSVMQNRRHQPAIRRLREGLLSGAIGEPMAFYADMFMAPRHAAGHLAGQPHPLLLEMAVHTFDQARYLSGTEAVAVTCHEHTAPHSWYGGAPAAVCTFELESGATFSYRGNWIAPGFATSYDSAWRIVGARGTAVWDSFGDPACEVVVGPPPETGPPSVERSTWKAPSPRDATGHAACVDELFDALAAGRRSETDGEDNLRTLAMVFAAIRSAEEGRAVRIEEIAGR